MEKTNPREVLSELGWNPDDFDEVYFDSLGIDEIDIITMEDVDTIWQVDIETGEYRHKGKSLGCFWTEWEG